MEDYKFDINKDYYKVLGVTPISSFENIERARDRLKFGSDRVSIWEMDNVDEAYKILSNKETREKYDEFLKNPYTESEHTLSTDIGEEDSINPETIINDQDNINSEPIINEQDNINSKSAVGIPSVTQVNSANNNTLYSPQQVNWKKQLASTLTMYGAGFVFTCSVLGLGSVVATGVGIMVPIAVLKLKKWKTDRKNNKHNIKDVKTSDTSLDALYDSYLKQKTNEILNSKYTDYNLQIIKARYENRIALTRAKTYREKNSNPKNGKADRSLKVLAYKQNLNRLEQQLKTIEEKIVLKDQPANKLYYVNDDLENINNSISEQKGIITATKLQIYKSILNLGKKILVKKSKFVNVIGKNIKDKTLRNIDYMKGFGNKIGNKFTSNNDEENIEVENNSKSM